MPTYRSADNKVTLVFDQQKNLIKRVSIGDVILSNLRVADNIATVYSSKCGEVRLCNPIEGDDEIEVKIYITYPDERLTEKLLWNGSLFKYLSREWSM